MWLCEYIFRTIETHVISLWFQFSLIGFILLRVLMEDSFLMCRMFPNVFLIATPPVPPSGISYWRHCHCLLSPSLPPYRKAETESGKLVTVKKKKKNTLSAHPPDFCCCHREVTATTSFDRKLQPHITPKTRGTSALLKYTVSHHQHICHAKVPRRHPATSCWWNRLYWGGESGSLFLACFMRSW